jgi:pimeloyl-ACP methyl ester carboxylesterase
MIAVDRPGHGHSERGPGEMSDPARQADLIAKVLDRLRPGPTIVLGHSWGAAVAAALAQRHPDHVAGLVLVSPATHPWPGGVSRRTRFFAASYFGRLAAEFAVVPLGLVMAGPAVRLVFAPDPLPQDYMDRIGALLAIRPKTFVANARDVANLNRHVLRLSARYYEIRAPTEIVTGDRDPIVSPAIHAYGLARDIPGARLTVLPGAGHMPHWSRTEEVVAAIERAIDRLASQSRAAE